MNSLADEVDANPGDGVCAAASGFCTLRAAIEQSNALAGTDTIVLPPLPPPSTYLLIIVTELAITDSLTMTGGGTSTTIIDGNKSVRPFELFPLTVLSVSTNIYIQRLRGNSHVHRQQLDA